MVGTPPVSMPAPVSKARVYLALGRVSNLPTIWTNVAAGVALGGGTFALAPTAICLLSMTSFYIGGMFLNDAFDRDFDREKRPDRPIAQGLVRPSEVFAVGFGLLGLGMLLALGAKAAEGSVAGLDFFPPLLLGGAIVLYDVWHKANPVAPWIMGLCRALVYINAALIHGGRATPELMAGALGLLGYVVTLTYVARYENASTRGPLAPLVVWSLPVVAITWIAHRTTGISAVEISALMLFALYTLAVSRELWRSKPRIGRVVIGLIAGISLLDGAVASATLGAWAIALGALATLGTHSLQRVAKGT